MVQPIQPKTNDQLQRAKRVPVDSIYINSGRNKPLLMKNGYLIGLCCAHDDHNPSMAMYIHTNTVYCFACSFTGDSIALYMKLYDVDFKTAIKELNNA